MSETPWTPGPWESRASFRGIETVIELPKPAAPINCGTHYTRVIAKLDGGDSPEWIANARLIASAPEMAELLERIYDDAREVERQQPHVYPLLAEARALLSRIKGDEG